MKNTLVVVTDLGGLKAYRLDNDQLNSTPRLELLDQFSNAEAQARLVEQVTDLAGRFPRSTAASPAMAGMSAGERHNIQLEQRRRSVRRLAGRINWLMRDSSFDQCFLAASREMNHQLLDELDPQVRARINQNVPCDLMKVAKSDLMRHFRARAVTR